MEALLKPETLDDTDLLPQNLPDGCKDPKVDKKDFLFLFERLHRSCGIEDYDEQMAGYLVENCLFKQPDIQSFDSLTPTSDWIQNDEAASWKERLMDQVALNMAVQKEIGDCEIEVRQLQELYQEEREQFSEEMREAQKEYIQKEKEANTLRQAELEEFLATGQLKQYLKFTEGQVCNEQLERIKQIPKLSLNVIDNVSNLIQSINNQNAFHNVSGEIFAKSRLMVYMALTFELLTIYQPHVLKLEFLPMIIKIGEGK